MEAEGTITPTTDKPFYKNATCWYTVIAMHTIISSVTFAVAYCLSFGGIDMGIVLSKLPLPDHYIKVIDESGMGHVAFAMIFMKLMTPVRFAATMLSSLIIIRKLQQNFSIFPHESQTIVTE